MTARQPPRIALLSMDAVLPPDRAGRRRIHRLWHGLAARAAVTPIVLGDTPPPGFRRRARDAGAVFLPRRPYDAALLRQALAEGRRDIVLPGLAEIRGQSGLPDWLWDHLAESDALTRHALNPRRTDRLLHRLRRMRPALVVLGDAALGALAPHLRALGLTTVLAAGEPGPEPGDRRWRMARDRAIAAAMVLAAPHLAGLWLDGPGQNPEGEGHLPADRILHLPDDAAALQAMLGSSLRALGLPVGAPRRALLPADAEAGIRGETIRFNPHTRLLSWSFQLRLVRDTEAFSAAFRAEGLATPPANAFVTLQPAPGRLLRVDASAVLPPDLEPRRLTLEIRDGAGLLLRRPVPARLTLETAGLLMLERDGTGLAVTAWSDAARVTLFPKAPLLRCPGPVAPAILTARLAGIGGARALAVLPLGGSGQALVNPDHWVARRHPSTLRLEALRERHAGQTAWLLGNGPSVRMEDLDALHGRLTFGFNRFHLAHGRTRLRPTYTVTGDRQMIEDFGQSIVDDSMGTVFVAHEQPPALTGDYIWLRQLAIDPPLFSRRPAEVVSPGGSSLFVALQLGHFMGVRRFYLYGTDFRFTFETPGTGDDPFRMAVGEGNHFILDYRGGRPWCPPSLRDIAAGFHIARRVMEAEGGFVRNASRGGLMEMFPRESFEAALAAA